MCCSEAVTAVTLPLALILPEAVIFLTSMSVDKPGDAPEDPCGPVGHKDTTFTTLVIG